MNDQATIFALSSGAPPAGLAVIRISGTAAFAVAGQLVCTMPQSRHAALRTIRTRNGLELDRGLVLLFPGPSSFTGEDCVELQIHGGRAVVAAVLHELASFPECRLAENGEFSRRALENGRIDLVEVEGLADLIAAETEMQRRLAIEQAGGGLSGLYSGWANRLTRARALIEAELDFADEDDVPGSVSLQVWADMQSLSDEMKAHLKAAMLGEIVRDGLNVVIAGPPNAGKSSLLNLFAGRSAAIVTDIPGTTRDVLQVDLDIEGYAVRLYDTAGLRETSELIESEGIRRAYKAISDADIVLSLAEIGSAAEDQFSGYSGRVIKVGTKSDIHDADVNNYDICISTRELTGLAELRGLLVADLAERLSGLSLALPSRLRHRTFLSEAAQSLDRALRLVSADLDLRAEDLRLAGQSLGRITGAVGVEDLLDVIFAEFCIGK